MKEITSTSQSSFAKEFNIVAKHAHRIAIEKGWWDDLAHLKAEIDMGDPVLSEELHIAITAKRIALIHSEVSEALESLRIGNPPSQKIAASAAEEELADVVIRIMDMAAANGWDIGGAIVAKIAHNKTRPHKHGKLF